MTKKNLTDNLRKRKRTIPTRTAGAPVNAIFEHPGDDMFSEAFSKIENKSSEPELVEEYGQVEISKDKYSKDKYGQVEISKDKQVEISPSKNYTKTPNSVIKLAIPEKYFRGQSKHTYDVLYQRTRGAIVPTRQIQLSKTELVKLTGLSEKTVQLHIRYLRTSNLISVHPQPGSHNGWIYEVFVPEEIESMDKYGQDKPSMDKTSQDNASKNLSSQTMQNLSILDHSNLTEDKGLNKPLKTFFKDNKFNDDEARAIGELLTIGKGKAEDWCKLIELLKMEYEIAAARTKTVTNAPAFLTEHLRRRLMPEKRETSRSKPYKASQVGKHQPSEQIEEYQAEALTQEGRESTLKTFSGYIEKGQRDFLMGLQDTYTTEDWEWLMSELKIE
jgi:hypothetical protein